MTQPQEEFVEPGLKFIGRPMTNLDVRVFLSECANRDPFIDDIQALESAKDSDNWIILHESHDSNDFEDEYDLQYQNEKSYTLSIEKKDISKVYLVALDPGMYGTAYRYFVFETTGQYLCLGDSLI
jgi:hypothetical protein